MKKIYPWIRTVCPAPKPLGGCRVCPSAFKAEDGLNPSQTINPNFNTVVEYERVVVDLNNEYDPETSTFTPKQNGIYSIIGSVSLGITNPPQDSTIFISIRVNGDDIELDKETAVDTNLNIITISRIMPLNAGDEVQIVIMSNQAGSIIGGSFQGARFN
jgi:hypothetical protein